MMCMTLYNSHIQSYSLHLHYICILHREVSRDISNVLSPASPKKAPARGCSTILRWEESRGKQRKLWWRRKYVKEYAKEYVREYVKEWRKWWSMLERKCWTVGFGWASSCSFSSNQLANVNGHFSMFQEAIYVSPSFFQKKCELSTWRNSSVKPLLASGFRSFRSLLRRSSHSRDAVGKSHHVWTTPEAAEAQGAGEEIIRNYKIDKKN